MISYLLVLWAGGRWMQFAETDSAALCDRWTQYGWVTNTITECIPLITL